MQQNLKYNTITYKINVEVLTEFVITVLVILGITFFIERVMLIAKENNSIVRLFSYLNKKSNRITNGNSMPITIVSNNCSGSPGSPKPPKKKWKKKLKEHLLKHQKSYGVFGVLILSGLGFAFKTDLDINNIINLINEVKTKELDECLDSAINSYSNPSSYYKNLIDNLNLGLSLSSTIISLDYIKLSMWYGLANNSNSSLFIRFFLSAVTNTSDSTNLEQVRTNVELSMIDHTTKSFLNFLSNLSNLDELFEVLKNIKILSNPLSYDNFKLFKQLYKNHIMDLGIRDKSIAQYFNLNKNTLHSNPVLNMAILIYNSDLKIILNDSSELNLNEFCTILEEEGLRILFGFHLNKPVDFITKNTDEFQALVNSLFIQGLRNFYYYKKLHNPSFNIQLNYEDYTEFYKFYLELASRFKQFGGHNFINKTNYDFLSFYSLITSLEYEDVFEELRNQLLRDFPDSSMPTTLSDTEDMENKLKKAKKIIAMGTNRIVLK